MTDARYYNSYEEYFVDIRKADVAKFVEALLFYLDTGLTDLVQRAEGDIRNFRAGWETDGRDELDRDLLAYRVLTVEPTPEGGREDYIMMEVIPQGGLRYKLRIMPSTNFLHKIMKRDYKGNSYENVLETILRENRLEPWQTAPMIPIALPVNNQVNAYVT